MYKALQAADTDQDGLLSASDMERCFKRFRLPSSDATIFFDVLDIEGRGRIWWREIVAIMRPMLAQGEPCGLFFNQWEEDDWNGL